MQPDTKKIEKNSLDGQKDARDTFTRMFSVLLRVLLCAKATQCVILNYINMHDYSYFGDF